MRSIDLITKINHLTDADEIFAFYRSLRQDELIWQGYAELSQQEGFEEAFISQGEGIDPGTLALYALDPAVQFDNFQANVYSHELFESIMLGYEEYIAGNTPVSTLQQATRLALALLEKQKLTGDWTPVLTDTLTRMKYNSPNQFHAFWGAPIAILANLTEKKEELSRELLEGFNPQLTLDVFLHSLLCQPLLKPDLLNSLQGYLTGRPPKQQAQALRRLMSITERSLVQELAIRLLEEHQSLDLQPGEARVYWENPESSAEYALKCQSVADLAEFAGDFSLARQLAGKSVEIMNAISAIARIKQSALLTNEIQTPGFSETELDQQEVKNELAFTNLAEDLQIEPDSPVYAVKLISQSKRMKTAGNDALASNEISGLFSRLTDEEIEKTLVKGPRFSQVWDSVNLLNSMVNSGDFDQAIRMAQIMLRANPVNKAVNFAAARALHARGQFEEAVEKLEFLNSVDPDRQDVKRDLVQAYMHTNSTQKAYTLSRKLLENQADPKIEDSLVFSELAINQGDLEEAQKRLASLLEADPQNARALSLQGMAYYQAGDYIRAEDSLARATEISDGEVEAWIIRSQILARKGEGERAIEVLKQGMAANPGNHSLRRANAMLLIAHEKLAEAYPVLRELSHDGKDHEVDVQLIRAMKSLGIADFSDVIETLSRRYPEDLEIQGEYGRSLVLTGDKIDGLTILKQVKQATDLKPDWALAFLEASLGKDHSCIQQVKTMSTNEQAEILELLDVAFSDDTASISAGVLKGEFYLQTRQSKKAFDVFSDLVELTKGDQDSLGVRVLAGLAESAAQVDKLDIARAAISDAVERQPDWDGLNKIKSEILRQSGAIEEAYKTARFIQATGPVYLEKLEWFTSFLESVDKEEEAQIELKSALEANPDDVGIQLLYAEQIQALNPEESEKTLMGLKDFLSTANDPIALRKAAILFERQASHDLAEEFLRKSANLGDDPARLNLAGYLRRNLRYTESVRELEEISSKNDWTALFTAETYFANDEILKAYQSLPADGNDLPVPDLAPEFLPVDWSFLMQSSAPITRLALCMDLKGGVQTGTMQTVKDWVKDGETVESHVFGVEAALAAGDGEVYDHLVHSAPVQDESVLSTHFLFLRIENELDNGNLEDASKLLLSLNETEHKSFLARLLKLRCDRLQVNRWECEQRFEELVSELDLSSDLAGVQCLAVWRNVVKAALSLDRYQEAYEISQKALQVSNANHMLNLLSLEAFVMGIEFRNACSSLDVKAHLPFSGKTGEELSTELACLSGAFGEKPAQEVTRIIRHGRLAINPTQEDLRALAVITPDAWDASAMMSGLRATGQVNLARQIARKFMDDPKVCFEIATCNEQEYLEQAIEALNASLMKDPDQPLGLALISRLLEEGGDKQKAAAAMEEASSLWPNEVDWQLRTADLWTKLGSLEKPVGFLEAAHNLAPQEVTIQEKLGKAYLAAKNPQKALEFLEPLVRQDAQRVDLWMHIADAHTQAGNLEMAMLASERTCELAPDSSAAHLLAARVYRQRGDLARAIEQGRAAVSINETDPEGHVFLAGLFLAAGDKLSALESLEKASRCPEVSVKTLIEHAELMKEINGEAAARDLIKSFSRQYPENPELLGLLAQAEEACGNLKQAELAAKKVLELRPEESGMTRFLGMIQQKSGNLDQAAYFYSQVIARDPLHAEDYLELSKIFIQQREFEKARKVFEDGIQHVPGCIDLYLACAVLLKEAKDYRGAEAMLRKASAIDPRNLTVQRQLGAVLALNLVHRAQEVSTQQ